MEEHLRPPPTLDYGSSCVHCLPASPPLSLFTPVCEPPHRQVTLSHTPRTPLEMLDFSQCCTVPVPIRISAQSAPTSLCRGTTCLSAVSLLIWNSQDSQAQWSYLSPQHSGACSYVFEASLGHTEMKGFYKHKNTTENWLWTMQDIKNQVLDILTLRYVTMCMTTKRKIISNITSKYFGDRLASQCIYSTLLTW